LFSKGNLGVNIYRAAEDLEGAVNQAGLLTSAEDPSFLATHSITADYDAHIETIWSRVAQILDWPDIVLLPEFLGNHANSPRTSPPTTTFLKISRRFFLPVLLGISRVLRISLRNLAFKTTTF